MNAKENSARCRHKKIKKQYAQYKIQKEGILRLYQSFYKIRRVLCYVKHIAPVQIREAILCAVTLATLKRAATINFAVW